MKRLILYGALLGLACLVFSWPVTVPAEPPAADLTQTTKLDATTGATFAVLGQAGGDTLVGTSARDIIQLMMFYADGADSTDLISLTFKYGSTENVMKQRVYGKGTSVVGPLNIRCDSIFISVSGAQAADWYALYILGL